MGTNTQTHTPPLCDTYGGAPGHFIAGDALNAVTLPLGATKEAVRRDLEHLLRGSGSAANADSDVPCAAVTAWQGCRLIPFGSSVTGMHACRNLCLRRAFQFRSLEQYVAVFARDPRLGGNHTQAWGTMHPTSTCAW